MTRRIPLLLTLSCGLFVAMYTSEASAWVATSCDGRINDGLQNNVTLIIDSDPRCPTTSLQTSIVNDAIRQWNAPDGMRDRFFLGTQARNCLTLRGDGVSTVQFVPASNPALGGNAGIARKLAQPCIPPFIDGAGDGELMEVDIFVSNDVSLTEQGELGSGGGARRVLVHELGHTLGMEHSNAVMSVMCNSVGEAVCGYFSNHGNNGSAGLTGNAETMSPDDAEFGFRWNSGGGGKPDLVASGFKWVVDRPARHHTGLTQVCPGQVVPVSFSVGNKGKISVTTSNPGRLVLSSDATISTADLTLANFTVQAPHGFFGTGIINVTVPNVAAGFYLVGVLLDTNNTLAEDSETNNAMPVGMTMVVKNPC